MILKLLPVVLFAAAVLPAQNGDLNIYWIDTEGGAATLIVTPSGRSLLVDTGNPGPEDRDPKRIAEAAKLAGLKQIDAVLITHFHSDHVGGVPALSKLIPIARYYDHGESIELGDARSKQMWDAYLAAAEGKRTILKPGDKIPLDGVDITVLIANGQPIANPVNGGGPNPFCKDAQQKPPDTTENQRSVGILLTYGKFKFMDMGDLTWDKEMELACPVNKVGTATLFQATHHGFHMDYSGAPAFVWAVRPQVIVVNNGARKGLASANTWDTMAKSPDIEGIWQSHKSLRNDEAHNTPEQMIANFDTADGNWIRATVEKDGKFTLTNGRNNYSKTYTAR